MFSLFVNPSSDLMIPCHAVIYKHVQAYKYAKSLKATEWHVIPEVSLSLPAPRVTLCLPQSQTEHTRLHMPSLFTCSSFLKGAVPHTRHSNVALETRLLQQPMGARGLWHVCFSVWINQTWYLSGSVLTGGDFFNQLTQGRKHTGQ